MANLNSIAKKLQKAILQKGLVIKMGTSQFYSVEQNRLITMHILSRSRGSDGNRDMGVQIL